MEMMKVVDVEENVIESGSVWRESVSNRRDAYHLLKAAVILMIFQKYHNQLPLLGNEKR